MQSRYGDVMQQRAAERRERLARLAQSRHPNVRKLAVKTLQDMQH